MTKAAPSLTQILDQFTRGEPEALSELVPLVERELHRMAAGHLRKERPGHTLQPTALVNELYLLFMKQKNAAFKNREHFFAVASLAMRQILVGYARKRNAEKRGHGWLRVTLDESSGSGEIAHAGADVLELDRVLTELTATNERQAQIVQLRYFGGMSVEETALVLGLSPRTVNREWVVVRAWLHRRLKEE